MIGISLPGVASKTYHPDGCEGDGAEKGRKMQVVPQPVRWISLEGKDQVQGFGDRPHRFGMARNAAKTMLS
jgi:hypothetical protein